MDEAAAIGIDIGGTRIKAVAVDEAGHIVAQRTCATPATPATAAALIDTITAQLDHLPRAHHLGVSAPGLVGPPNRAVRWMRGRLDFLEGLNFSDALGRDAPVINDGLAAVLGEAWCGAARGLEHVVMLTLGTGVGGGVLVGGRPMQGAIGRAGHLGHITLDLHGQGDLVNTPGSLEDFVGDHSVGERTGGRYAHTHELVAAAEAGDVEARRWWSATVHALACAVVSLINIFDPQAVIVGGGIVDAGDALMGPLRRRLEALEWRPLGEAVVVRAASLGPQAGAVGAARFAMMREQP